MTIQEIKALATYLKEEFMEVFATKQDLAVIDQKLDNLTISVDSVIKKLDNHQAEIAAGKSHLDRHEGWIQKLAQKVGINLGF